MVTNFSNSRDLLMHAGNERLYEKLISQLQKDFLLANIPIDLTSDMAQENLKNVLHEKIYYLLMEKFPDYLNLLYIVDVNEREFKKIEVTDVVEVAEQVSLLILKRELQKVWLKMKFS